MIRILSLYLDPYFLLLSPRSWLITTVCLQNTKVPVRQEEVYNDVRSWKEDGHIKAKAHDCHQLSQARAARAGREKRGVEGLAQGTGLRSRVEHQLLRRYVTEDEEASMFSEPRKECFHPQRPPSPSEQSSRRLSLAPAEHATTAPQKYLQDSLPSTDDARAEMKISRQEHRPDAAPALRLVPTGQRPFSQFPAEGCWQQRR